MTTLDVGQGRTRWPSRLSEDDDDGDDDGPSSLSEFDRDAVMTQEQSSLLF